MQLYFYRNDYRRVLKKLADRRVTSSLTSFKEVQGLPGTKVEEPPFCILNKHTIPR
jgi:hypothetical protein